MSPDHYHAGVEAKLPAKALKALRASRAPVVLLSKGKPTMVVQNFADFRAQRESLLMLKLVVQSEECIAAGRTSPHQEVMRRLRASVAKRFSTT